MVGGEEGDMILSYIPSDTCSWPSIRYLINMFALSCFSDDSTCAQRFARLSRPDTD